MTEPTETEIATETPSRGPSKNRLPDASATVPAAFRRTGATAHSWIRLPPHQTRPDESFGLERVAEVLARGDSVTVVPVGKELTTQQAADLINVSRQYLVRLLDEGRIPYTKTGKHRRLRIEDVLAFRERRDEERKNALRDLSQLTEEFGGYENELK